MGGRSWRALGAATAVVVATGGGALVTASVGAAPAAAAASVTALPSGFGGIAVDPTTARVFVSSPAADTVTALDLSGHVLGSATGLAGAGSLLVSGGTLYVALRTAGSIAELDPATLAQTGTLAGGALVQPGPLVMSGGLLWTSTGTCGQWATQLASVDPSTGAVARYAMPSASSLGYCIGLAAAPQLPNTLLAWDLGLEPATISRIDVSSGIPVVQASVSESDQGNLQQIAVNPDGTTFVTASGSPYNFEEFRVSDLGLDGTAYPANAYPDAVVTSSARGGLVVGGMNGMYDPDVVAYHPGAPGTCLLSYDFGGSTNTVVPAGLALSPDGSSLFAVTGDNTGSGPTYLNVLPLANVTATTLAVSSPTVPGSPVTFTATVAVTSGGFAPPGGTVTFSANGAQLGSAAVDSTGHASLTVSSLPAGNYTATAAYGGDSDNQPSSSQKLVFQVAYPTTTSLTSSADPVPVGQAVTFTATVSGGSGATGTVTFSDGGTVLGAVALAPDGTAAYTTSALAGGSHTITAAYSGDTDNGASSAALTETVNATATSTSLTSNPNPSHTGESVTFTATVTAGPGGPAAPTGTVAFYEGSTWLGTQTLSSGGTASLTTGDFSPGTYTITADYSGDPAYDPSSASLSQTVVAYQSSTSLVSSANPATVGQAVTFSATVASTGPYAPNGTVTFYDGGTAVGTVELPQPGAPGSSGTSSEASLTLADLQPGGHTITASYSGDAYNDPSESAVLSETVNQAVTTTGLTSSGVPQVGQSVTFTATVTGSGPTGTVTFSDGSTPLATVPVGSDGVATYAWTATGAGTHAISASYGGDADNTASSAGLNQVVSADSSATVLTSSSNPVKRHTAVTLTATVTSSAGAAPAGTVTFYVNGKATAKVTLGPASGGTAAASYTTSSLPGGRDTVTATYASTTSDVTGSTSASFIQTVK